MSKSNASLDLLNDGILYDSKIDIYGLLTKYKNSIRQILYPIAMDGSQVSYNKRIN